MSLNRGFSMKARVVRLSNPPLIFLKCYVVIVDRILDDMKRPISSKLSYWLREGFAYCDIDRPILLPHPRQISHKFQDRLFLLDGILDVGVRLLVK